MTDNGWDNPQTIMFGANAMFNYRLCVGLIESGALTQQQAATIMLAAANDVRSGTEDGVSADFGEKIASRYEVFAGWLLGKQTNF